MLSPHARPLFGAIRAVLILVAIAAAALAFSACGDSEEDEGGGGAASGSSSEAPAGTEGFEFLDPSKLLVGMSLQFKPQAYLDDNDEPAGYDVDLLTKLTEDLGVELDIANLDFTGLIPGLQAKQFDMVSSGLSATPERKEVIDMTRPYIPFALILAVPTKDEGVTSVDSFNAKGKVVTVLQGSTGEQLAKETFPEAEVKGFPDQNAAFLEVATGRADATVVEDYQLVNFQNSNPDQLAQADLPEPLDVQYGTWAVPKGNSAFVEYLDEWLCKAQGDGTLAEVYEKNFGVEDFPPMPDC